VGGSLYRLALGALVEAGAQMRSGNLDVFDAAVPGGQIAALLPEA
jgi:hypothetical protein